VLTPKRRGRSCGLPNSGVVHPNYWIDPHEGLDPEKVLGRIRRAVAWRLVKRLTAPRRPVEQIMREGMRRWEMGRRQNG
jgi:hypothetical protein